MDNIDELKEQVIELMLERYNIAMVPDSIERKIYEILFEILKELI